jgi:hypothetical protein
MIESCELKHGVVGTLNRFTMWHLGEVVAEVEHTDAGDWIVTEPDGSRHRYSSRPLAIRRCSSLVAGRPRRRVRGVTP